MTTFLKLRQMQLSLENAIALPFFQKMEIAAAFLESAIFG
jgi:hypothetical protein